MSIIGTISFKTYHTIFWGLTHKNGQNQGKKCSNIHQISFLLNLSLSLAKNPSFCDFKSIFQFSDVTQTDFKLLKIMIKCRKYAQEHHILVVQIHGTYNIWKNNILGALKTHFRSFYKVIPSFSDPLFFTLHFSMQAVLFIFVCHIPQC